MPSHFTHYVLFSAPFRGFVRTVQVNAGSNQLALESALDYVGDNDYDRAVVVPFTDRSRYSFKTVTAESWVLDPDG